MGNMGLGPKLSGGVPLGATQVQVSEIRLVGFANVDVEQEGHGLKGCSRSLRVVDMAGGLCLLLPADDQWFRRLAQRILDALDGPEGRSAVLAGEEGRAA